MTERQKHPARKELSAWLDGELRPQPGARVRAHIGQCHECAEVVAAYRRHDDALNLVFGTGIDAPVPRTSPGGEYRALAPRIAATVIALLVLFAGGVMLWSSSGTDRASELTTLGSDAFQAYRRVSWRPDLNRESGADNGRHDLSQWASTALGRHIQIPDLGQRGYRLVDKWVQRLVAEKPAAVVAFQNTDGRRIVCYFMARTDADDSPLHYRHTGGVTAVYRTGDHIGYAVVGNVGHGELLSVVALAYPEEERAGEIRAEH